VEPRGVRIVYADGTELPCEVEYRGWHDGSHCWEVANRMLEPGMSSLHVAVFPPYSSIAFALEDT